MPTGTATIHFLHPSKMPVGQEGTYLQVCANYRPQKAEPERIRFTVGGNFIEYHGKVSTPTAHLTTIKLLLNSIISTPNACFMTADIKEFYLNTPMSRF
jgi:hypothetical protein